MKWYQLFLVALISIAFCTPWVTAQPDHVPPPSHTAVLGSKEYMRQYQNWLDNKTNFLPGYFDSIMNFFGMANTTITQNMNSVMNCGLAESKGKSNCDFELLLKNQYSFASGYLFNVTKALQSTGHT